MRETRLSGSEGGGALWLSLPLSGTAGRWPPLADELLHLPGEPAGVGDGGTLAAFSQRTASPAGRAGRGRGRRVAGRL